MGKVEGNKPISDNDWEAIVNRGRDETIQNWIDEQLKYKSCTIVLVGKETANRKWIKYEIKKSWEIGNAVLGIHVHNLKDSDSKKSLKGKNPFCDPEVDKENFSKIVKCYDPPYTISNDVYAYIKDNISDWVEVALEIRKNFKSS